MNYLQDLILFLGRQASEDADENGDSENQLNNKDVELSTGNDNPNMGVHRARGVNRGVWPPYISKCLTVGVLTLLVTESFLIKLFMLTL